MDFTKTELVVGKVCGIFKKGENVFFFSLLLSIYQFFINETNNYINWTMKLKTIIRTFYCMQFICWLLDRRTHSQKIYIHR